MWTWLAKFILKNRLSLIIGLVVLTALMGFFGRKAELSYDFMKIVPPDDPDMIYYSEFNRVFGEDANMFAIGIKDSSLYQLEKFNAFAEFNDFISEQEGIIDVVSIPKTYYLLNNKAEKKFESPKIFSQNPTTQAELDSILKFTFQLKYFEGRLFNPENLATVILISMDEKYLNSKRRGNVVDKITEAGEEFSESTGIHLHYAGLPYVRTSIQSQVKKELNMFLVFSLIITGVILFLFFRSFSPVIFSLAVIGMVVIWTLGTIALLGYKITMLTGLLPPILVVIGIPNCIYLLNKYHQEYALHGDKNKALSRIIRKIGIVTLITNTTTAIGFFVLTFTDISVLKEFGIVATINIIGTFLISIIFIPAVFSYRPAPESRHIRHLSFEPINKILLFFDKLINYHRGTVYAITIVLVCVSLVGMWKIRAIAFMVDDIPEDSIIRKDLAFFESNFKGIMPLEIVVDTKKKKGIRKRSNIQKVEELETYLSSLPEVTNPVSLVSFYKAANQAYFNNNPKDYKLPAKRDEAFIQRYLKNADQQNDVLNSFVDTSGQIIRVSMKVADLGSIKMDTLVNQKIRPAIDSIFAETENEVHVTGTTLLFIKGNQYLISNLRTSMIIAFFLIALIMGTLFKNVRMIIISLVPNMVPLIVTAGLMGFLNVPLKPSTVLVFSIAFGISVDDSIHFLAKYRQELVAHNFDVVKAISISLKETGTSMIYTSIVLFFGFVIFGASDFGGTVALGALTSTTLLIAMITNLILLPCLLRSFDITKERISLQSLFEKYDNFYVEDEDEEIDISLIEVKPEIKN
ncbi:efflux RND transporter permease subunit [Flexithrix dorotheae]|uniref:efflux RND transporter permease subunit n=1 Tax=Flexithrix dorotheae TaxID=70993 RepID=UPI00037615B2|nr:efflux RND transporter permease subunit [Flexithrix dorotheae]